MAHIGVIGLGNMGLPMAMNLLKASHNVTGFDLQEASKKALQAVGGHAADSVEAAIVNQDIVITMLQTGAQVQAVCQNAPGILNVLSPSALYIDCSTIDVGTSQQLHAEFAKRNISMVDAPVSGGVGGAVAGTLTFMVGGDVTAYERAYPILQGMGELIVHAGEAGSGVAAKICNNLILGVSMIAVSEAFQLAAQIGLSKEKLFEIVNHASGQCWVMSQYPPVPGLIEKSPANRDYEPGFASAMMLKDLLLSQQTATQAKITLPMSAKAAELYQQFCNQGGDNKDFSAIIKLLAP